MKSPLTIQLLARARRMLPALLIAAAACQGGVDNNRGPTPPGGPNIPPPPVGSATLFVDQTQIPADGTTLVTAHATVTDARGIAVVGEAVEFSSTVGDVTWITVPKVVAGTPASLFPTVCDTFTGTDGSADCVFRSGFTPTTGFINVTTGGQLGLAASEEVHFTFGETFPGVVLTLLTCPDSVGSGDLPAKKQIAVMASAPQPGNAAPLPVEDVRVYYTTTVGVWDRTLNNHSNDSTDNAGISDQELRLSTDDNGQTANAIMTVAGALPVPCTFLVGDFTTETKLTLNAQPKNVLPDGSAQEIDLHVQIEDTSAGNPTTSPKVDHHISFSTPVGTIAPNPLLLAAGGTGGGDSTLSISSSESAALIPGQAIDIVAVDDVSRAQAFDELTVPTSGDEGVQVGVGSATFDEPDPPDPSTVFVIKVNVTTTNGAQSGRRVSMDFGDLSPNGFATTDVTGLAQFTHTFNPTFPDTGGSDVFGLTAVDLASNVTGTGTITFTFTPTPPETVTVTVPSQVITLTSSPTDANVLVQAILVVTGGNGSGAGNRQVAFNFGDNTPVVTQPTDPTGTATVAHVYSQVTGTSSFNVIAADTASGTSGTGIVSFTGP